MEEIVRKYGLENAKPVTTLSDVNVTLVKDDAAMQWKKACISRWLEHCFIYL